MKSEKNPKISKILTSEINVQYNELGNHKSGELIGLAQGALNGFCSGISIYHSEEYGTPGIHSDQEAFYVIEGIGYAKVGNEEFKISSGSAFIALPGVPHTIRKTKDSKHVKVLWVHGAV